MSDEQELRDRLWSAMDDRDAELARPIIAEMLAAGLDARTIAYNILFDIDETKREWWMRPAIENSLVAAETWEEVVATINEAAAKEPDCWE